jgi:hypothetical protein
VRREKKSRVNTSALDALENAKASGGGRSKQLQVRFPCSSSAWGPARPLFPSFAGEESTGSIPVEAVGVFCTADQVAPPRPPCGSSMMGGQSAWCRKESRPIASLPAIPLAHSLCLCRVGRDGPDLLLRQIKENKSMFMEVDEEEYAKLVAKRRQEDFVEDDGVWSTLFFPPQARITSLITQHTRGPTLLRPSRVNQRMGLVVRLSMLMGVHFCACLCVCVCVSVSVCAGDDLGYRDDGEETWNRANDSGSDYEEDEKTAKKCWAATTSQCITTTASTIAPLDIFAMHF